MTHRQLIWRLLTAFLVFAVMVTIVALFVGSDASEVTTGWIVLAGLTILSTTALALLDSRWFLRAPENVRGALMMGVFMRIAIGELVFVATYVMFFTDLAHIPIIVVGLLVSILLVWVFATPTERNILSIQDQLERVGGSGDIAVMLSQPLER